MRNVLRNAAIGATLSSAAVLLFSAIRRVTINLPYVWLWALVAGVCYGWLALEFSIYGSAGIVLQNWKNGLLSIVILIAILPISIRVRPLVHVSVQEPIAVALAASISMIVSDALEAPNQRWRSRYSQDKRVRG